MNFFTPWLFRYTFKFQLILMIPNNSVHSSIDHLMQVIYGFFWRDIREKTAYTQWAAFPFFGCFIMWTSVLYFSAQSKGCCAFFLI